jgi:cell division septation protein DedD
MDTAVKERLVGGAILVLLVVLVVPAILTGPREPPPPEPDGDGATKTVEIDLGRSQRVGDVAQEPVTEPATVPTAPTGLPDTAAAPVQAEAIQAAPAPAEAPPAQPAADAAQSPAPVQGPPPARQEPAAPGSGWAVQLAAFSSQDSARKMVADLRSRGYSAFVLEYRADSRVLYRVRVGPEAQRERAAALASRLQGEGFKATVVAHP